MSSTVDTIKERLSIADVLGSYVKLEKAGVNLKARCPFHHEKTPSFIVSPARGTYYCFGCAAKGDIFSFIEAFEGVDFKGALKVLAERAGVEIVAERKEARDERERSHMLLDAVALYFEETLTQHEDVISYLVGRGAERSTLKRFRVGFAEDDWHGIELLLKKKGFREKEMLESGLVIAGPKGIYDRFRSRIMFPLADSSGRTIAFSGRIFETSGATEKSTEAKYINSPETMLFSKSHVLYGYDKAKLNIRKWNFSIVVEGQMDLLMSHQAGYSNTVAPSGTALTGDQLSLLKRLSSNIVLAFDADTAGLKATERGAHLALGMGMDVKVALLPPDSDPADLIAQSGDAWKSAVKNAKHVIDFYLDAFEKQGKDMRTFRRAVADTLLPFLERIPNKIDQAHFISRIAARIGIDAESVRDELKRKAREGPAYAPGGREKKAVAIEKRIESVPIDRMVWNIILWQRSLKEATIDLRAVENRLKQIYGREDMEQELASAIQEQENRIFEAEEEWGEGDSLTDALPDMFYRLGHVVLERKYALAKKELDEAETRGDTAGAQNAFARCNELTKKLFQISAKTL